MDEVVLRSSKSYDSGAGNGVFGYGCGLSLPAVTRKADKGLRRYEDAAPPPRDRGRAATVGRRILFVQILPPIAALALALVLSTH